MESIETWNDPISAELRLWDLDGTQRATMRVSGRGSGNVFSSSRADEGSVALQSFNAVVSTDGRAAASVEGGMLHLYDLQSRREAQTLPGDLVSSGSGFSPGGTGRTVFAAVYPDGVSLWDAQTDRVFAIKPRPAPFSGADSPSEMPGEPWPGINVTFSQGINVTFSPDGTTVTTVDNDADEAEVWDTHTGHLRGTLNGHSGTISRVEYDPDPDDARIRTFGSTDDTMRVYDVPR